MRHGDVRGGDEIAAELGESGRFVHLDVTQPESAGAAVAAAVETFGGLDVLVDDAGIVNVSSSAGMQGYEAIPGYVAAKWGVRGFTKAVALDLGRYGVRCSSIHPGVIRSPMTADLPEDTDHVALHRIGEPEEVSRLVVFLASDDSSYATGAEFVLDGGETAGRATKPE